MSTKDILREVSEKLPPDATLADAIHELELRQAIEIVRFWHGARGFPHIPRSHEL
jgi:hypothetical protein